MQRIVRILVCIFPLCLTQCTQDKTPAGAADSSTPEYRWPEMLAKPADQGALDGLARALQTKFSATLRIGGSESRENLVQVLPHYTLIDRSGSIRFVCTGNSTYEDLETEIQKLLAE